MLDARQFDSSGKKIKKICKTLDFYHSRIADFFTDKKQRQNKSKKNSHQEFHPSTVI
jgi:hypothetical protein